MKKILFIHHSTGANLIREGRLRNLITNAEFWDHSYNLYKVAPLLFAQFTHHKGLSDKNGKITGQDYDIVLSNNNPREYAEIFGRDPSDPTLKSILSYDIVAFKNCYPTTKIISDAMLHEYGDYYKSIFKSLKKYSEKEFVLVTPPPLREELTTPEYAERAKKLVSWLLSQGTSNIKVFNLFGELADENGFLKKKYSRLLPWDSHPNNLANQTIAPVFAAFLNNLT